eukprot:2817393-Rhodomonas_salina.1
MPHSVLVPMPHSERARGYVLCRPYAMSGTGRGCRATAASRSGSRCSAPRPQVRFAASDYRSDAAVYGGNAAVYRGNFCLCLWRQSRGWLWRQGCSCYCTQCAPPFFAEASTQAGAAAMPCMRVPLTRYCSDTQTASRSPRSTTCACCDKTRWPTPGRGAAP